MKQIMKASATNPGFQLPILPQSDENGIIDFCFRGLDSSNNIVVNVDRLINRFVDGDTISVCFGDQIRQHLVDSLTDQPSQLPYTFKFAARDLPNGQHDVYYKVQEPSFLGGSVIISPSVSVIIVKSPDGNCVIVRVADLNMISDHRAPDCHENFGVGVRPRRHRTA